MKQALLTVSGKDRPGIVSAVTEVLFRNGVNLEDVSMKNLEGEFAMMLILSYPALKKFEKLGVYLEQLAVKENLVIHWVDLGRRNLKRGADRHGRGTVQYLISIIGKDKTGIVFRVSQILAKYNVNITDLQSQVIGHGKKALYAMLIEVDVPVKLKMSALQRQIAALSKKIGLDIQIKKAETIQL